jgi:hypothetical protein
MDTCVHCLFEGGRVTFLPGGRTGRGKGWRGEGRGPCACPVNPFSTPMRQSGEGKRKAPSPPNPTPCPYHPPIMQKNDAHPV